MPILGEGQIEILVRNTSIDGVKTSSLIYILKYSTVIIVFMFGNPTIIFLLLLKKKKVSKGKIKDVCAVSAKSD